MKDHRVGCYDVVESSKVNPQHQSDGNVSKAAVKLQKVYRSYRTRRRLADSAVIAEELWWQAIDYARLSYSTVSFFDYHKSETAASRWNRISLNASKIGKGLGKDSKAKKLAFQHWIEAIDPRHRYGHNLNFYYKEWRRGDAAQPFFYWLDVGDGKDVDLKDCPRARLRKECIKYLGPQEREQYEYIIEGGIIMHKLTGNLLDTNEGLPQSSKWIFIMNTSEKLYVGQKKKGIFHHSSFLAGGATLAAGRLVAECGKLKHVSAYSGHYRPTDVNLGSFLSFLQENGVNLEEVQVISTTEDHESYHDLSLPSQEENKFKQTTLQSPNKAQENQHKKSRVDRQASRTSGYKRTLSSNLPSSRSTLPKNEILQRIESKKEVKSYQLAHRLSRKWSYGTGPRIGCIADYPPKLRFQAMELVNLSSMVSLSTSPYGSSPRSISFSYLCSIL